MKIFQIVFVLLSIFLVSCTTNDIRNVSQTGSSETMITSTGTNSSGEIENNNLDPNENIDMQYKFQNGDIVANMTTTKGKIIILLNTKEVPITTNNFIGLAKEGYYNGVIFHRVIKDFMIQGGDPDGTGMGGKSIYGDKFVDEFSDKLANNKYTISMANAGPNTNGSQFFINVADNNYLNFKHSVFGKVVEGQDNVLAISKVKTQSDRPVNEVKIIKIEIKEYQDGKFVDYLFDKKKAEEEYKSFVETKEKEKEEQRKNEMEAKKDFKLEMGDVAIIDVAMKTDEDETPSSTTSFPLDQNAEILTGLRDALIGMKIGNEKSITLEPKEAFGEYEKSKQQVIQKSDLLKNGIKEENIKVGNLLQSQAGIPIPIIAVDGDNITLDYNIPFAGKKVTYKVKVKDIQKKK